ncbi:MAG: DNA polymerase III subunit epsilon [Bacteroidetes bacterium SW_9_63_38]|nr:MAG: DNA polymerase III subunit epsilon [Bacteroidetes bacterium SW_9_63_38]
MLHLERPLVFLDLEATGTDPQEARIIQIALQRFVPSPSGAALDQQLDRLVNPEMDIPADVTDLTGITTAELRTEPTFADLVPRLAPLLSNADLAGYNAIAYDVPLLKAEFERADRSLDGPSDRVVLDPYRLEQVLRPRTLTALYERYTDTELDGAHDALADVTAAGTVLQRQLDEHDIDATPAELADRTRGDYLDDGRKLRQDGNGVVVCFGKHSGKTLQELQTDHPGYFDWMYETIDELRPHIDDALS